MRVMAALESEVHNYSLLKVGHHRDRLSKLPREILLLISSTLTMNDVGRLGLVSREYGFLWRCVPVLIFEYSHIGIKFSWSLRLWNKIIKERLRFVSGVNRVVENYLETSIDELRITCDLDNDFQSHVDKWAAFALDKQVKNLEFNFYSCFRNRGIHRRNGDTVDMCGECPNLSPAFSGYKSCLRSLNLKWVNVTDDFVDGLTHGCPLLENLCIVGSKCLTRISGSLQVKHLEVSYCYNLKTINLSATKLRSFILNSTPRKPIELLHLEDASSLSEMSICTRSLANCFAALSEYFSQFVRLSLRIPSEYTVKTGVDYFVAMPNLQHLEFHIFASNIPRLGELTSVLAVCPSIQKLTLNLDIFGHGNMVRDQTVQKWDGFPLKSLKTLEIIGYLGLPMDLELAFFVLENASMLEQVIVGFALPARPKRNNKDAKQRLLLLQAKLPQHVKLTLVK